MKNFYYLDKSGEVKGPFSSKEMTALHRSGKVSGTTQVCEEGTEDWMPYYKTASKTASTSPQKKHQPKKVASTNEVSAAQQSAEVLGSGGDTIKTGSGGDRIKTSCFVVSTLCLLVISIHSVRIERMLASVPRLKDVYSERGVERPASMPGSRWNVPYVIVQHVEETVDVNVKGTVDVDGDVEVTNFSSIPVEIQNSRVPVEVKGGVVTIDNRSFEPVPVTVR